MNIVPAAVAGWPSPSPISPPLAGPAILLGTVLLETNRWTPSRQPSFAVSAWAPAIHAAGFSGLELWENHAALADAVEHEALSRLPLPVSVFNSYCTFDDAGASGRQLATQLVHTYRAGGVKFNLGGDPALVGTYLRHFETWAAGLPAGCRPLCECHAGTVLEDPDAAARILAPFAGRIGIIVHPFAGERAMLARWFDRFGPAVSHMHVAARQGDGALITLAEGADEVRARLGLVQAAGFTGSWTIEFTKGVAWPPEDRQELLQRAAADMAFIRAHLTGGTAC